MTKSLPLDASSYFEWESERYWDRDFNDPSPPYFENPMDYALTFCDEEFAIHLLNSPDGELYMDGWNLDCAEFVRAYMPKFFAAIEDRELCKLLASGDSKHSKIKRL